MNKRGQFFLIAALVIVGLIISLAVVKNSVKTKQEDANLFDLSRELSYEGAQVLNSGIISGSLESQVRAYLDYYANATTQDTQIVILYGDGSSIKALYYSCVATGDISIEGATTFPCEVVINDTLVPTVDFEAKKVTIILPDQTSYTFDLKEGQGFYLVVSRQYPEGYTGVIKGGDVPIEPTSPESDSELPVIPDE